MFLRCLKNSKPLRLRLYHSSIPIQYPRKIGRPDSSLDSMSTPFDSSKDEPEVPDSGFTVSEYRDSNFYPDNENTVVEGDNLPGEEILIAPEWHEVGVYDWVLKALKEMNIEKPTIAQSEVIGYLLQRRDVLLRAQTGSGKSFGILLGLLQLSRKIKKRPGRFVSKMFVVPNVELANKIGDWAEKLLGCKKGSPEYQRELEVVTGLESKNDYSVLLRSKLGTNKDAPDMIVGTPKRLCEEIRSGRLDVSYLEILVLDEIDALLQVPGGKKKLKAKKVQNRLKHPPPAVLLIEMIKERVGNRDLQFIGASASLTSGVIDEVHHLKIANRPVYVGIGPSGCAPIQIKPYVYSAFSNYNPDSIYEENFVKIIKELQKKFNRKRALIILADEYPVKLTTALSLIQKAKISSTYYSNDVEAEKYEILISTENRIRGLDSSNNDFLLIFGKPASLNSYLHMVGRVGRMDQEGIFVHVIDKLDILNDCSRFMRRAFGKLNICELGEENSDYLQENLGIELSNEDLASSFYKFNGAVEKPSKPTPHPREGSSNFIKPDEFTVTVLEDVDKEGDVLDEEDIEMELQKEREKARKQNMTIENSRMKKGKQEQSKLPFKPKNKQAELFYNHSNYQTAIESERPRQDSRKAIKKY